MSDDVDPAEVEHVANLARIDLTPEEVATFADEFEDILEYFETLEEVPETDSDPDLVNVMRSDEVEDCLATASALENAPDSEDDYFKGPPVG